MPHYILTRKNTVGFRKDGKLTLYRMGDTIPAEVYEQLPERVKGYISDVAPEKTPAPVTPVEAPAAETEAPAEAAEKPKRRKKAE